MNETSNYKKSKFSLRGEILALVIVSLVVGGIAGGLAGLVTGGLYSGSLNDWLSNPLGILLGQRLAQNQPLAESQAALPNENPEEAATTAVSRVTPAVVSIIVTKELQQYSNQTGPGFPYDDFFNFPFDQFFLNPESQPPATEKQKVGGGTGFIISSDGLILTNKHVVADTEADYSVITNDSKTYEAKVIDRDPFNDVAVLKIEANNLPIVTLGDSDKVKVGQTVIAIGFSLGEYSNSVTKGIISGKGRDIVAGAGGESEKLEDVFQTDAAINPGNSGGPLINLSGEVIGINTAVNREGQSVGFAIPINPAKAAIDSVKQHGKIVRPYLGVRYIVINEQLKEKNNLKVDYGALIVRGESADELAVVPGSPADKAGLAENDIILEIDGIKLDQNHSLAKEVAKHQPGDAVTLKILHDGEEKTVTVNLEEYKK